MRLTLHTDFGLRTLMYLAHVEGRASAAVLAKAYGISREHLVKVVQSLTRLGLVETKPGRGGGVQLAQDPASIDIGEVIASLEGHGVLECVENPEACILEPGCRLRRKLMTAERAFYDSLRGTSLADLVARPTPGRGVARLTPTTS